MNRVQTRKLPRDGSHRWLRIKAAINFALILFLSSSDASADATSELPVIGVIAAQTGPTAHVGGSVWRGIEHAMKNSPNKLRFVLEDDSYSPPKTIAAFQKLVSIHNLKGLIVFGSPSANAIADLAEKKQIPMIYIAMTEKPMLNRKYIFRQFLALQKQTELILKFVEGKLSFAVVTLQNDGLIGLRDKLVPLLKHAPLLNEEVSPSETDLRSITTKIKRLNPQIVFSFLVPPHNGILARTLKNSGYSGQIVGGPPMSDIFDIEGAEGALDNAVFAGNGGNQWEEFKRKSFPNEDVTAEVGVGYDAALMFLSAQETTKLRSPEAIVSAFQSTNSVDGAMGRYGKSRGNDFDVPGAMYRITNGKVAVIEPTPAN